MTYLVKYVSAFAATIITATVAAGVASAGVPQHVGPQRGGPLAMADADKNGEITRAEWLKQATERFDALDQNKDGKIVWSELPRPHFGDRDGPRGHGGRGDHMPPPPPAN